MNPRYTIISIREEYTKRGFTFLGDIYTLMSLKYETKCNTCLYIWSTSPMCIIGKNTGCPDCFKKRQIKYSLEDIIKICSGLDIEYLETEIKGVNTRVHVRCMNCSYDWHPMLSYIIYDNNACMKCYGNERRTIEYVREKYLEKDILFLDDAYINNRFRHNLQCLNCNRIWQGKFASLSGQDSGCINCAGKLKYTFRQVYDLYFNGKILLLSSTYVNNSSLNFLKCMICGEEWSATLHAFLSGVGCPTCSLSKNEKITLLILKKLRFELNPSNYVKCDISTVQNKLLVDANFYFNNNIVIVEYNGAQHYRSVNFGQGYEQSELDFARQQKRDQWLRDHCKETGKILIEIDGRKYAGYKIKPYLISELLRCGITPPFWEYAGLAD